MTEITDTVEKEKIPVLEVDILFEDGEEQIANEFLPSGWKIPGVEGLKQWGDAVDTIYSRKPSDILIRSKFSKEKAYGHPLFAGTMLGLVRNGYNPVWEEDY